MLSCFLRILTRVFRFEENKAKFVKPTKMRHLFHSSALFVVKTCCWFFFFHKITNHPEICLLLFFRQNQILCRLFYCLFHVFVAQVSINQQIKLFQRLFIRQLLLNLRNQLWLYTVLTVIFYAKFWLNVIFILQLLSKIRECPISPNCYFFNGIPYLFIDYSPCKSNIFFYRSK